MNTFIQNIYDIQPSQLYISEQKLREVETLIDSTGVDQLDPLPVKKIGADLFFTDGHTRAMVLYKRGIEKIKVYDDEDDLDWLLYLVCLNWCKKEGIKDIRDLNTRVISDKDYQKLWIDRCQKLKREDPDSFIQIREVVDSNIKSKICEQILRNLPQWFGIEEAIIQYVDEVKDQYFLTAFVGEIPVGFISLKDHNRFTGEIYVMGVLKELHRRSIGKKLVNGLEEYLKDKGKKFLTVKTLSDSDPDENYKKTREFYQVMGFYPLEEFKTLWGEENPCLLMVKTLG